MTMPDFRSMTGPQLLLAYNQLVPDKPRRAKFSDRTEGIARCEAAWAAKNPAPPTPPDPEPTKVSSKDSRVIRLLSDKCPRRPGTDAAIHWEKMIGGITVAEYLAKFPPEEQRRARQWLGNTVRDGHATLLG